MSQEKFFSQVDKLLKEFGAAWEKTSVCTSWIMVAEWVDGDGNVWLEEHRTKDLPPWRRDGMLNYILTQQDTEQTNDN